MSHRLGLALAATWLVAQLGVEGVPVRCWLLPGVATEPAPKHQGVRQWLSTGPNLDGWLERVEVKRGDVDQAARLLGFRDLKQCLVAP